MPHRPAHDGPAHIAEVRAILQERSVQRLQRLQRAHALSAIAFQRALNALRTRIDTYLDAAAEQRPNPFPHLDTADLGILERQLEWYRREGRLGTLHGGIAIETPLQILRVNRVARQELVSGTGFRAAAQRIYEEAREYTLGFLRLQAVERGQPPTPSDLVLVVPWPSGCIAAETWYQHGTRALWNCWCSRDPETLASTITAQRSPSRGSRTRVHLVVPPVLATGRQTCAMIEELLAQGVPESRIAVQTIVAAPEGIDRILSTFRQIRLLAFAIDDHVDALGNVAGSGIGDFRALALRGVDRMYAHDHWIARGLVSPEEIEHLFCPPPERPVTPSVGLDHHALATAHPSFRAATLPIETPVPALVRTPADRAATDTPSPAIANDEFEESWAAAIPDSLEPVAHA